MMKSLAIVASLCGLAAADPAGDAALAKVEAVLNRAKTQIFEYEIANTEGEKSTTIGVIEKQKGEKVFLEFIAPRDMKGTRVLALSPTELYVYLPAFGKVRRIASSVNDEGFLGMALAIEDWLPFRASTNYTATVKDKQLVLVPKPNAKVFAAKIELTVGDKDSLASAKYYKADGKLARTVTFGKYTCEGDVCSPSTIEVVSDKLKSKAIRKTWKINENISDDTFSRRALGE